MIIEDSINNIIKQINLYKYTHPNLVNLWTTYLELKKENYKTIQCFTGLLIDNNDEHNQGEQKEYKIILDYLKNGHNDYTHKNIMQIFIYKMSLLDDKLFYNII
jgi:hypothetical protein